jgi:hypothetical protein
MGLTDWEGTEEFYGIEMFWSHYSSEKNVEIIEKSGFKIIDKKIDCFGNEKHLIVLAQKI